jgi:nucleoside-diphosphate-sugar epimerase
MAWVGDVQVATAETSGPRRVLVVGGTGLIGGHAALRLREAGHAVTIASRRRPEGGLLATLPFVPVDYIGKKAERDFFAPFDTLVFAAGNDYRHVPKAADGTANWHEANALAIPAFFKDAKEAGISTAILIGSWYPQAAPTLIDQDPYVASRLHADEGVRALSDDGFRVVVLNAPYVVGHVDGLDVKQNSLYSRWAMGRLTRFPRFTVKGGINVISTDTLSDAVIGAIERGEAGKAYLIGDENLTFQDYFGLYFKAAGDERPLEVLDEYHPFISDAVVCRAPDSTIYLDTDPAEVALLGYRRNDVERTIRLIVDNYIRSQAPRS